MGEIKLAILANETILHKKFSKLELYGFTKDPKDWIFELELLRDGL